MDSKLDILTALSQYNLENLIFQIFDNLNAIDLKCCQLVSTTWNYFVELVLQKLDQRWEEGQPSISVCQCDKIRSVCTISALSVDEDSLCVGLGSSGDLELWDRRKLERIWRTHAHDDGVYGIDMNKMIIVSAGDDSLVNIYNRLTGSLLKSLDHHTYIVWSVRLWLDTLFTASYDCTVAHIKFQMTETNLEIVELNQIQGPEQWADAMGADDTGQFMSTQNEENFILNIWDLKAMKTTYDMNQYYNSMVEFEHVPMFSLIGHTDEVHCVEFISTERSILSGGADKTVRLWSMIDGTCLRILTGHEGDVWCVDLDRHRIVAGGRYGEVRIWGRKNNNERSILLHSRSTAVGRIKLEPAIMITTDGLGSILISDFWKCQNVSCGCEIK